MSLKIVQEMLGRVMRSTIPIQRKQRFRLFWTPIEGINNPNDGQITYLYPSKDAAHADGYGEETLGEVWCSDGHVWEFQAWRDVPGGGAMDMTGKSPTLKAAKALVEEFWREA